MDRQKLAALREQRAEYYHKMAGLLESRGDSLSDNDAQAYDRLEARFDALDAQIRDAERGRFQAGPTTGDPASRLAARDRSQPARLMTSAPQRRGSSMFLDREERMADWVADCGLDADFAAEAREFSLGRLVQGMATGEWRNAEVERRALGSGSDATGGVLVPAPLAAETIDMLRNEARVIEAGARLVPMDSGTLSIPRLASGFAGATWRDELEPVAEDDGTFERVKFDAKTLAVLLTLPYELADDLTSAGAEQIENAIKTGLGLKLDSACLYDAGQKGPTGVKAQNGVTVTPIAANGATPTSYAPFISAFFSVRRANAGSPTAFIYSERTAQTVAGFTASDGQPLLPPPAIADVPHLSTGQVPDNLTVGTANGVCSDLFTGDFRQLWIGVRPQIGIRVERARVVDNMAVKILAYLRADVQLAHPEAFHVTTGIKP